MAEFSQDIIKMLQLGAQVVRHTPYSAIETGTVDAKGVSTIQMDKIMEGVFIDYLRRSNLPILVFSEDSGLVEVHKRPEFLVVIDSLDGSTNYKQGRGQYLPFGSFIAIYNGLLPSLADVIAAGAIEYTQNNGFIYANNQTTTISGEMVQLKTDWEPNKNTPVYVETYGDGYEAFRLLGGKLFIRNQGALVANLGYVLSNAAAMMGGIAVKSEEVGAIYGLIKGAGGVVVDHLGHDIGSQILDHAKSYKILAGSNNIVTFSVDNLSTKEH